MTRFTPSRTVLTLTVAALIFLPACSDEAAITSPDGSTGILDTAEGPDAMPFHVPGPGDQGCTPGFWKNNTGAWVDYSPDQTLQEVFDVPNRYGLDDYTLLDALSFGGGPGALGAAKLLLHHAVAALLNAAHSDIQYPEIIFEDILRPVRLRLLDGNRGRILELKSKYDQFNNLGCPLSADESNES